MFPFSQTEAFVIERIPYVLLLGVFCGLVSLYFTKVMNRVEGMYRNLNNYWKKFVVGGDHAECADLHISSALW